jgi:3-oxoacyl-(acyl-carrier-protein) synthase
MSQRVVVTGIGLIAPLNPFQVISEFWDSLCKGKDAIKKESLPMLKIDREWLMAGIDIPDMKTEHKLLHIAEEAFLMAIKDAGIDDCADAGISLGTVLGNVLLKERRLMQKRGYGGEESLSHINSYLSGKYGLGGRGITVSTACASGTDAIGIAARKIISGAADVMIAGGVDVLSDFAILGFNALQALTEEKVRPFDKNRSGLALGEGAAFIVLESEEHAALRGPRIYGEVKGYASRADANHLTGPHREGRGLSEAISCAMSEGKLKPEDINYINAHGTGTVYNDLMETKAIKKVFGRRAYNIPISSTKSMLGHSFGAAGVIEAVCCLLAINTKTIPPTINYGERDPECDLDYVPNTSRKHEVKAAISLSAGFGGQNSALILGAI